MNNIKLSFIANHFLPLATTFMSCVVLKWLFVVISGRRL